MFIEPPGIQSHEPPEAEIVTARIAREVKLSTHAKSNMNLSPLTAKR
jgi:hypothetical protein